MRLETAPQRLDAASPRHAIDRVRQRLGDAIRARLPDNPFAGVVAAPGGVGKRNDQSCVLHVRSPHGRVLLPADIEARAERRLMAEQSEELRAELLVAPHHGSKVSSTDAFIAAVRPDVALFPVGYRNRFRHPHPAVLARYDAAGVCRLGSPSSSAIEARLTAGGIETTSWRARHRRYWHQALDD